MMSSIACSRMARRPRAPRLRIERLARHRLQRALGELELHAVHLEELLVLLHERVLRLREDVDQRVFVQLVQRRQHRQAADELRDQAELEQVLRLHLLEQLAELEVLLALDVGAEAERRLADAPLDDLLEAHERAAADEEDVRRVDLQEILLRVLAAALGGHVGDRRPR